MPATTTAPDVQVRAVLPSALPWTSLATATALLLGGFILGAAPDVVRAWGFGHGPAVTGRWWTAPGSFFPHVSAIHLVLNAIYLVCVGAFVEPMLGRLRTAVAIVMCHVAGLAFVVAWADPAYAEVGASNAIHGLLSCGYVFAILGSRSKTMRFTCAAGLAYFLYMSVHAIRTGHMPWPVAFFANGGHGHLGGILVGSALGWLFHRGLRSPVLD